jgi:hypothetical protein
MTNEHHYAVVVGINRYPGIRDLQAARRDAEDFANWLRDPSGGALPDDDDHIIEVPASTDEEVLDTHPPTPVDPVDKAAAERLGDFLQRTATAEKCSNKDVLDATPTDQLAQGTGLALSTLNRALRTLEDTGDLGLGGPQDDR